MVRDRSLTATCPSKALVTPARAIAGSDWAGVVKEGLRQRAAHYRAATSSAIIRPGAGPLPDEDPAPGARRSEPARAPHGLVPAPAQRGAARGEGPGDALQPPLP